MVDAKKGHNSVNISWNSLKSLSGRLNIDPNLYAKYQNITQGVLKTSCSLFAVIAESKTGHNLVSISQKSLKS